MPVVVPDGQGFTIVNPYLSGSDPHIDGTTTGTDSLELCIAYRYRRYGKIWFTTGGAPGGIKKGGRGAPAAPYGPQDGAGSGRNAGFYGEALATTRAMVS